MEAMESPAGQIRVSSWMGSQLGLSKMLSTGEGGMLCAFWMDLIYDCGYRWDHNWDERNKNPAWCHERRIGKSSNSSGFFLGSPQRRKFSGMCDDTGCHNLVTIFITHSVHLRGPCHEWYIFGLEDLQDRALTKKYPEHYSKMKFHREVGCSQNVDDDFFPHLT